MLFADAGSRTRPNTLDADDAKLVRAQRGERYAMDQLLRKYRRLVEVRARSFRTGVADPDDLAQVGMIGLWRAIMDYRWDRSLSFEAYASLCIRRYMVSALKSAYRQQRCWAAPGRGASAEEDGQAHSLVECIPDPAPLPEEVLVSREALHEMRKILRLLLTEFEWQVLIRFDEGVSYREIAGELQCSVKAVDNALTRLRRKVHAVASRSEALRGKAEAGMLMPSADVVCALLSGAAARPHKRRRHRNGLRAAQAAL